MGKMSVAAKALARALAGAAALAVAGCGGSLPSEPEPPRLPLAWVAYADDGTVIAASRQQIVRLDGALNEIDRIVPPYPFDQKVSPPGLTFFGISHDGRVVAMSWQSDSHHQPIALSSGAIVFEVPSRALLRSDSYPGVDVNFQGLSLSPDGLSTAAVNGAQIEVSDVAGGGLRWQASSGMLHPPVFTADSSMLILADSATRLDVRRALDGFGMFSLPMPGTTGGLVVAAGAADGLTLAAYVSSDSDDTIAIWRLPVDSVPLRVLAPPSDLGGFPQAIALGPDAAFSAGIGMVAVSYVSDLVGDGLVVWRGDQLVFRRDDDRVWSVAFSPDGTTLATVSTKRGVQLLRADDGAVIAEKKLYVDDL